MTHFRIVDVYPNPANTGYVITAQAVDDKEGLLLTAQVGKEAFRNPRSEEAKKAIQMALQARYDGIKGKPVSVSKDNILRKTFNNTVV